MNCFDFIPDTLYSTIYTLTLCGMGFLMSIYYLSPSPSGINRVHQYKKNEILALLLGFLVILFIGCRPISGVFVDMPMYAHVYNNIYGENTLYDSRGEWVFYLIGTTCKEFGLSDKMYFLILSFIYYGCMVLACWRLMRRNFFLALIFCFTSFSCFSYGVNGLRNGVGCSLILLSITFLGKDKWNLAIAIVLMFLALNIHRSTLLPSVCALVSMFWLRNTKMAIFFWVASILISALIGNYVTEFFVNLGFDDRMEQYANLDQSETITTIDQLSGFRIDFIIYSIMPIIMAWYVTIKRNFKDKTYNIIAITYILSNAFWIMVIRSEQSNRFAYLSWFLYPLVIAYPLLRMNIWEDQDKKTGIILLCYVGFTFFMNFIYYG